MRDIHVKSVEDDFRIFLLAIIFVAIANFDSVHDCDSEVLWGLEKFSLFQLILSLRSSATTDRWINVLFG